jgi:hypothetical protein
VSSRGDGITSDSVSPTAAQEHPYTDRRRWPLSGSTSAPRWGMAHKVGTTPNNKEQTKSSSSAAAQSSKADEILKGEGGVRGHG